MTTLLETVYSDSRVNNRHSIKVDRAAGIIRNVKVLGRHSKNDGGTREYSEQAIADAARMYEGKVVYLNHPNRSDPKRDRDVRESFGELRNVKLVEGEPYADLHYNTEHQDAGKIAQDAEKFPRNFGLSHNADGAVSRKGGKTIVESITNVISVDLVTSPATNKGLFESEDRMAKTTVQAIWEKFFPKTVKGAVALIEDDMGAMPVEVPEGSSSDDQIWSAFKTAIMAAVDDDGLDIKATLKKIGDILKGYEKLTSTGAKEPAPGGTSTEAAVVAESLRESLAPITAELKDLKRRAYIRDVSDELGVRPDASLMESLLKQTDDAEVRKLLEREANTGFGGRKRSKPLMESVNSQDTVEKYPDNVKSFASSIKG